MVSSAPNLWRVHAARLSHSLHPRAPPLWPLVAPRPEGRSVCDHKHERALGDGAQDALGRTIPREGLGVLARVHPRDTGLASSLEIWSGCHQASRALTLNKLQGSEGASPRPQVPPWGPQRLLSLMPTSGKTVVYTAGSSASPHILAPTPGPATPLPLDCAPRSAFRALLPALSTTCHACVLLSDERALRGCRSVLLFHSTRDFCTTSRP